MERGKVLMLYRQIMKAAKTFPSIKRDKIVEEIRHEFRAHKVWEWVGATCTDLMAEMWGLFSLRTCLGFCVGRRVQTGRVAGGYLP